MDRPNCTNKQCHQTPCPYPLRFGPMPIPPLCCLHQRALMHNLSKQVPGQEGREGFTRYEQDHRRAHGGS